MEFTERDRPRSLHRVQCKSFALSFLPGMTDFLASCHCAPFWLCSLCQFPIWKTNHTLKWEGVWRELGCLARTASFAVREESGHSLKSSLAVCVHYNEHVVFFFNKKKSHLKFLVYVKLSLFVFTWVLSIRLLRSQHAMVIDTRNSPILPNKGALLKINQVCTLHLHFTCSLCTLLYISKELKKHFRLALKQFFVGAGISRLYGWRCQIPEGGLWNSAQ